MSSVDVTTTPLLDLQIYKHCDRVGIEWLLTGDFSEVLKGFAGFTGVEIKRLLLFQLVLESGILSWLTRISSRIYLYIYSRDHKGYNFLEKGFEFFLIIGFALSASELLNIPFHQP